MKNGLNADSVAINGTPGKRNALSYGIDKSLTSLASNKTLKKSGSPYLVPDAGFTIGAGKTLTIEPGVVIKVLNNTTFTVNGAMQAAGTAADPIVFTSFHDDTYGGDTNQNGTSTLPQAGNWASLRILAEGSAFDRAVIRYGGIEDADGNHWANLRIENASPTVKNSTIEYSKTYGVYLKNATSTIEANIVRFNNRNISGETQGVGIAVSGGAPTVLNNTITANTKGLTILQSSTASVTGNTFTSNIAEAVNSANSYASFSGNSASGNGTNGILFSGPVSRDYTIAANLPYVVKNTTVSVAAGKTLTVNPGAVIKLYGSGGFSFSGKLVAEGGTASKIVFTSLNDDDCGISGGCGDTNATTTLAAAGDWYFLKFLQGAASSTLDHVTIRYGGSNSAANPDRGTLLIKNTSIDIKNATIEKNGFFGLLFETSTSTVIANSAIRDHQFPAAPESVYGLYAAASSTPLIKNTTFSSNRTNVAVDGTSSYVDGGGNVFE